MIITSRASATAAKLFAAIEVRRVAEGVGRPRGFHRVSEGGIIV